ncbi:MAG: SOS response-associated peptidase [Bacteroidia bacterium]|nr:SOS response-associated peptidase [Bacteroidia bacterium]
MKKVIRIYSGFNKNALISVTLKINKNIPFNHHLMCYAISINEPKLEKLAERIGKASRATIEINFSEELYRPYHFVSGFTFPDFPVAIEDKMELFKWGLIPAWVKDEKSANDLRSNTLNAKSETIFDKPSFRKAITTQRCIIPINGFIEWQTLDKEKQPYFIKPNDESLFLLGGLYDKWINPETGEFLNTFSIITTEANPLMAEIHNSKKRMPLILDDKNIDTWLDKKSSKDVIQRIFRPYDQTKMTAYQISKMVNSTKNNRNIPEILNPIEVMPEQGQLSLF